MHQTVLDELGDNHASTVVAQTASVDVAGLEVVAQGVHRQQWGVASLVAEVITELAASELRTTVGLSSDELCGLTVKQVVAHEGEGDTTEVTATAEAANHDVGIFACHRHLLLCLQTDDGLVQTYVVEHGAQRIFTIRCGRGELYSLRDGRSQRAGVGRILGQDVLTGTGRHGGRTFYDSTEGAHDAGTVGLLLHGDLHLIDGTVEAVDLGSIAQSGTPLASTRLSGDVGGAFLLGIVTLG